MIGAFIERYSTAWILEPYWLLDPSSLKIAEDARSARVASGGVDGQSHGGADPGACSSV